MHLTRFGLEAALIVWTHSRWVEEAGRYENLLQECGRSELTAGKAFDVLRSMFAVL